MKVRINQYNPVDEWKRLVKNKSIHAGWRYTFGAYALTKYTLTPGRLFGNDEYNPFTNSISLYSDRPSIALREGAHAKQALEANYPGAMGGFDLLAAESGLDRYACNPRSAGVLAEIESASTGARSVPGVVSRIRRAGWK